MFGLWSEELEGPVQRVFNPRSRCLGGGGSEVIGGFLGLVRRGRIGG